MATHGQNFGNTRPTILLNGVAPGTQTQVTEYLYKYTDVPSKTNPCTITISATAGEIIHYTWGPQHPTFKVDNISCFKYTGPITLTNNKNQDGNVLYVTAFSDSNVDGLPDWNTQSPVVTVKFHVNN
jgi:hypothetical protein